MKLRNLLFYLEQLSSEELESTALLYNPITKRLNEVDHLVQVGELPSNVQPLVEGKVVLVARPQV